MFGALGRARHPEFAARSVYPRWSWQNRARFHHRVPQLGVRRPTASCTIALPWWRHASSTRRQTMGPASPSGSLGKGHCSLWRRSPVAAPALHPASGGQRAGVIASGADGGDTQCGGRTRVWPEEQRRCDGNQHAKSDDRDAKMAHDDSPFVQPSLGSLRVPRSIAQPVGLSRAGWPVLVVGQCHGGDAWVIKHLP